MRRDCASQSQKASRDAIAKNTRCWQMWKKANICFDDITGKKLPWHAVRKARELKYLRDLGVYEKIDENEAVAKYGITPVRHEMG